jgi:tetratricopeptide (TPR) repeat protein
MLKPLERFRNFLGEGRFWMLVGLLVTTGIASLILAIINYEQTITTQTILALGAIVGTALIIGSRISGEQRIHWLAILAPSLGMVVLALLFFPQYLLAASGAAVGWIVAGMMIFGRRNAPMQYREAIKSMRKGDYKAAVATLDSLIKTEPDNPAHYRLRGRVLRLWGKTGRARHDYEAMIKYSTNDGIKAEAYNELSELELQAKNYEKALESAQNAADLLPNDWVAAYNLGMIQDRLGQAEATVESLQRALDAKVKDARHRLLIHLWMTRAYSRLGESEKAKATLANLKKERKSLDEWHQILEVEEAAELRNVLGEDVALAQKLVDDEIEVMQIAKVK